MKKGGIFCHISGAEWNESFWNKPEFDKIQDDARGELDFEKRSVLYQKAQKMLYEEGGTLIPFHFKRQGVFRKNISGFEPVSLFHIDWTKIEKK